MIWILRVLYGGMAAWIGWLTALDFIDDSNVTGGSWFVGLVLLVVLAGVWAMMEWAFD